MYNYRSTKYLIKLIKFNVDNNIGVWLSLETTH